jgi:hypothetical protein
MRRLLVMGLLPGVPSCSVADRWVTTPNKCTVMRVTERYIALHYPEFDSIESPPILLDNGDSRLVYYKLPEDTLGGTPEVIIDKRALKVLRAIAPSRWLLRKSVKEHEQRTFWGGLVERSKQQGIRQHAPATAERRRDCSADQGVGRFE